MPLSVGSRVINTSEFDMESQVTTLTGVKLQEVWATLLLAKQPVRLGKEAQVAFYF